MKNPVTRLDDCQYLFVSPINYTLTTLADHWAPFSHDALNRYLSGERITPRLVWENGRRQVVPTPHGYGVFDDPGLDTNASLAIALVRRQYSGTAKAVLKGMGVVTWVDVHPALDRFWLLDYRMYDPDGDGTSPLEHVREMLAPIVYQQQLPFEAVLMDTWYATRDLMWCIESLQKYDDCPRQDHRPVDDSGGMAP